MRTREGLFDNFWQQLAEGWQSLRASASRALTRFTPPREDDAGATEADGTRVPVHNRWGLLPADVSTDGNQIVVRLEVPGLDKQDLHIEVDDGDLLIQGEKRRESSRRHGRYHIRECAYGSFRRRIPLPAPVEEAGAKARYERGILTVELPRAAQQRERTIPVG